MGNWTRPTTTRVATIPCGGRGQGLNGFDMPCVRERNPLHMMKNPDPFPSRRDPIYGVRADDKGGAVVRTTYSTHAEYSPTETSPTLHPEATRLYHHGLPGGFQCPFRRFILHSGRWPAHQARCPSGQNH